MACCGRGPDRAKINRTVPIPKTPNVTIKSAPARPPVPTPAAPPGTFNPPGKFCPKCGWVMAITKYADPITNAIIEKRTCTNRQCVNY